MTTNVQGERGHTLTHDGHSLSRLLDHNCVLSFYRTSRNLYGKISGGKDQLHLFHLLFSYFISKFHETFREESRNIILEEISFHLNVDFNSLYGVYLVLMKGSCTMFTVVYFYIESNYKMINT